MKENEKMNRDLDARLNSPGQKQIANIVRDLPEDTVSMAWRSALNEKLAPMAAKQERARRITWIWKPSLGLALAATLAVVMVMRIPDNRPASSKDSDALEAGLVAYHQDSTVAMDVAGPGSANPQPTEVTGQKEPGWTEDDLSSL